MTVADLFGCSHKHYFALAAATRLICANISNNYSSILTQPNMYARGILFGKMKYELGDHSFVRCPELDLVADVDFKTKGWVGGTYNAIGGVIKRESTGEVLFELSGLWSEEMYIKDMTVSEGIVFG